MNGFRITLLVLLCLAVSLMFYAVMVVVPGWQTQHGEYQAAAKLAEFQQRNDSHRLRMEQFGPEAETPEIARARAAAEESARKNEQALTEAEESSVIAAAKRREEAARTAQPAEPAETEAKPLGLVASFDKEWNALMVKPVTEEPLTPGLVVAVRREGRIVCEAVIDVLDTESGQYSATVKNVDLGRSQAGAQSDAGTQPAVGDEIIISPFPDSTELRGGISPAPLPAAATETEQNNGDALPTLDATLTPIP